MAYEGGPVGDPPKKPKEVIGIRVTPEMGDWLRKLARATDDRPELTMSQVAMWVLANGREYLEVVDIAALNEVARRQKTTRAKALKLVITAGLLAFSDSK
jgi:hypothetical protein